VGVVLSHNGSASQTVKAHQEVIVSAGVIGSAQLLMLSGIGPRQHLTDLKVWYMPRIYLFRCISCE